MKFLLTLGLIAVFVIVVSNQHGKSAPKWPSEAQARGEVTRLVDAMPGPKADSVDYCVAGISANTFDCQVMISNVTEAHPESQPTFWSLKCDPAAQTCRIAK